MNIQDDNTEATTTETGTPESQAAAPATGGSLLTTPPASDDGTTPTPEGNEPAADGEGEGGDTPKDGEPKTGEGEAPALFGAPADDAAYDVNLPEGVELDKAMLDAVTPLFRKMDLSNAGAQEFIDAYVGQVQPALADQIVGQIEANAQQQLADARADTEAAMAADASLPPAEQLFDGATPKDVQRLAAKALDKFGSQDLRNYLDATGLGNDKHILQMFYRVGKATAEDTDFPRGVNTPVATTREERFYGSKG